VPQNSSDAFYTLAMTLFRRRLNPLPPEALTSSDAPPRVRVGYIQLLAKLHRVVSDRQYSAEFSYDSIEDEMLFATRRTNLLTLDGSVQARVEHHLRACDWEEFYESVEAIDGYLQDEHPDEVERHRRMLDQLLADEGVLLEFGEHPFLHLRFTEEFELSVNAALRAAPPLYGAQLRKAIDYLGVTRRDPEAAIKEAVGALEGVAAVVVGRSGTLEDLSPALRQTVHPQIIEALRKLYAFRGRVAAHAALPTTPYRGLEAVFVVHVCAAAIALFLGVDATIKVPVVPISETGTFDPDEIPF